MLGISLWGFLSESNPTPALIKRPQHCQLLHDGGCWDSWAKSMPGNSLLSVFLLFACVSVSGFLCFAKSTCVALQTSLELQKESKISATKVHRCGDGGLWGFLLCVFCPLMAKDGGKKKTCHIVLYIILCVLEKKNNIRECIRACMHTHLGECVCFNWQMHRMLAFKFKVSYVKSTVAKTPVKSVCVCATEHIHKRMLGTSNLQKYPLNSLKSHQRKSASTQAFCPSCDNHSLCMDTQPLILLPSILLRRPGCTQHTCCWCVCSPLITISLRVLEPPVKSNQKWQRENQGASKYKLYVILLP